MKNSTLYCSFLLLNSMIFIGGNVVDTRIIPSHRYSQTHTHTHNYTTTYIKEFVCKALWKEHMGEMFVCCRPLKFNSCFGICSLCLSFLIFILFEFFIDPIWPVSFLLSIRSISSSCLFAIQFQKKHMEKLTIEQIRCEKCGKFRKAISIFPHYYNYQHSASLLVFHNSLN